MRTKVNRGGSVLLAAGLVLAGAACGGGGSSSSFCDVVEDAQADFAEFEQFDGTNLDNLEETFTQAAGAFEDMADAAPSEIKDDMQTLNGAMQDFISILEDADWDVMAVATDADAAAKLEAMSSDEFAAASDRVAEFAKDECGVDLGSSDSTDDGSGTDDTAADSGESSDDTISDVPVSGDMVEQLAAVYEETFGLSSDKATCLAEAIFGAGGDLADASDPSAFMDLLDDCDISPDEIGG